MACVTRAQASLTDQLLAAGKTALNPQDPSRRITSLAGPPPFCLPPSTCSWIERPALGGRKGSPKRASSTSGTHRGQGDGIRAGATDTPSSGSKYLPRQRLSTAGGDRRETAVSPDQGTQFSRLLPPQTWRERTSRTHIHTYTHTPCPTASKLSMNLLLHFQASRSPERPSDVAQRWRHQPVPNVSGGSCAWRELESGYGLIKAAFSRHHTKA